MGRFLLSKEKVFGQKQKAEEAENGFKTFE